MSKSLDDLLKSTLQGAESMPPPCVWESVGVHQTAQKMVMQSSYFSRKKFYLFGLGLALLGLGSGAGYFYAKQESQNTLTSNYRALGQKPVEEEARKTYSLQETSKSTASDKNRASSIGQDQEDPHHSHLAGSTYTSGQKGNPAKTKARTGIQNTNASYSASNFQAKKLLNSRNSSKSNQPTTLNANGIVGNPSQEVNLIKSEETRTMDYLTLYSGVLNRAKSTSDTNITITPNPKNLVFNLQKSPFEDVQIGLAYFTGNAKVFGATSPILLLNLQAPQDGTSGDTMFDAIKTTGDPILSISGLKISLSKPLTCRLNVFTTVGYWQATRNAQLEASTYYLPIVDSATGNVLAYLNNYPNQRQINGSSSLKYSGIITSVGLSQATPLKGRFSTGISAQLGMVTLFRWETLQPDRVRLQSEGTYTRVEKGLHPSLYTVSGSVPLWYAISPKLSIGAEMGYTVGTSPKSPLNLVTQWYGYPSIEAGITFRR